MQNKFEKMPIPNLEEFLYRIKQDTKNEKVYLLLSDGNKGDGLILEGTRTLLAKVGIDPVILQPLICPKELNGKVLLIIGGGAFNPAYDTMSNIVPSYLTHFDKIIILPSSFDLTSKNAFELIKNAPKHLIIFCREKISYSAVLSHAKYKENIKLAPDTSLYIDWAKYKKEIKDSNGILVAIRTDNEQLPCKKIFIAEWILKMFKIINYTNVLFDDASLGPASEWKELIKEISPFSTVVTNRAHVAIAATMLGKKTIIFANVYHKVRAIYDYSLCNYANTIFI